MSNDIERRDANESKDRQPTDLFSQWMQLLGVLDADESFQLVEIVRGQMILESELTRLLEQRLVRYKAIRMGKL